MRSRSLKLSWLVLAFSMVLGASESSLSQGAATTQVRLILGASVARPGETIMAGVELRMAPNWHTYWRNGGDAGSATEIRWSLPEGVTAGEILWPVPEKFETEGLYTYGYHDKVLLLVPLSIASTASPGTLELKAEVAWLECEELCIPGQGTVVGSLVIGEQSEASSERAYIDEWQAKLPQAAPGKLKAQWDGEPEDDTRSLIIEWDGGEGSESADFYPWVYDDFEVGHATEDLSSGSRMKIRKQVQKYEGDWPRTVAGLLMEQGEGSVKAAREAEMEIGIEGDAMSTIRFLWFAFLGGLILNIMPCVLPVISLKILGFVNQSRERRGRVRLLGLMHAVGVLVSFLVLAGLVIGVQQAGKAASWGMQFQNPLFLVCMTVLVTLVALNLFGLFEVTLGGAVIGAASSVAGREGSGGAFATGVLATALATPCTAPFLAPALGFAFTEPPWIIILFFLTIGAGFALPYLLLSWFPGLLRFMPRPGAWMERFKIAMGFPMLATAFWLFHLLVSHYGDSGVLWIGLFLVCVGLAAWVFGQFVQRGRRHKGVGMVVALVVLLGGYAFAMERQLEWRTPRESNPGAVDAIDGGIDWKPWSVAAVEQGRREGRPILVDFTAKWCVTCNVNKETSIEIQSVRKKLEELNVLALIGDYTRGDDAITQELLKFGRAGVPLVLVYSRDGTSAPVVLPAVLTPGIVLDALVKAAQ